MRKRSITPLMVIFLILNFGLFPLAFAAPSIILRPQKVQVGSVLNIQGTGFTPNSTVSILMALKNTTVINLGNATTDNKGGFNTTIKIPQDFGGEKKIGAVDLKDLKAEATVTVIPKFVSLRDAREDVGIRSVSVGRSLTIIGSGATGSMVLAIDNGPVAGKPTIDPKTGDFRYQFVALGSPGLHVVSLYDDSGELIDKFLYNVTGITNSDLVNRIRRLELGMVLIFEQVSDVFSQVSKSAISSDSNTLILRQDLQKIQKGLLESIRSSRSEFLGNLTSSLSSVEESISSSSSKLSREISLVKSSTEDSAKTIRDSIAGVEQRIRDLAPSFATIRQEITSSSGRVEGAVGKVAEALSSLRTETSSSFSALSTAITAARDATARSVSENSALIQGSMQVIADNTQNLIIVSIIVATLAVVVTIVTRVAQGKKAH